MDAAGVVGAEVEPFEAGEAGDCAVDGCEVFDAGGAGEEERAHSAHRGVAANGYADRGPEISDEKCGEPARGGWAKAEAGLVEVESEVAAFVFYDSIENRREQRTAAAGAIARVFGRADESIVTGQS